MPKQTAVEWLKFRYKNNINLMDYDFNQALEMEQEQIEDAFNAGVNSEDFFYPSTGKLECEIYYEETYRK
jgi:hypothetical protein